MKKIPYCVPQIIESVLETAKIVSDEVFIHKKVLNTVIDKVANMDELVDSEHDLMLCCLRTAYKALGAKDPYEQKKQAYNIFVESQKDFFNEFISTQPDPLTARITIAAALNYSYLCIGSCNGMDISKIIQKLVTKDPLPESEINEFSRATKNAESILYIVASAGEIVADSILIEELAKKYNLTVAVASHPLICRAIVTDAEFCGIDKYAEVIDPGADMYGIHMEKVSKNFREHFKNSDVVIVKNGVNAETLEDCGRDYFVLGADRREKLHHLKPHNNVDFSTNIRKFLDYIEA